MSVQAKDVNNMADNKRAKTSEDYNPGTADEGMHGWAPDAPRTGEAAERVNEANKKAREASDTQDAATGAARQDPDLTGGHVPRPVTLREHGPASVGRMTDPASCLSA